MAGFRVDVEAIDRKIIECRDAAGITRPPIDGLAVAEAMRLRLEMVELGPRGRIARYGGKPTAYLRIDERPERRHFAALHELGELIFGGSRGDLEGCECGRWLEATANVFASRHLAPQDWFVADCLRRRDPFNLPRLKRIYSTASFEVLARRMLDVPGYPCIITIIDAGMPTSRQGSYPFWSPKATPVESIAWKTAHDSGEYIRHSGNGVTVDVWPIHEPGNPVKREIMRTVLED